MTAGCWSFADANSIAAEDTRLIGLASLGKLMVAASPEFHDRLEDALAARSNTRTKSSIGAHYLLIAADV